MGMIRIPEFQPIKLLHHSNSRLVDQANLNESVQDNMPMVLDAQTGFALNNDGGTEPLQTLDPGEISVLNEDEGQCTELLQTLEADGLSTLPQKDGVHSSPKGELSALRLQDRTMPFSPCYTADHSDGGVGNSMYNTVSTHSNPKDLHNLSQKERIGRSGSILLAPDEFFFNFPIITPPIDHIVHSHHLLPTSPMSLNPTPAQALTIKGYFEPDSNLAQTPTHLAKNFEDSSEDVDKSFPPGFTPDKKDMSNLRNLMKDGVSSIPPEFQEDFVKAVDLAEDSEILEFFQEKLKESTRVKDTNYLTYRNVSSLSPDKEKARKAN